MCSSDLHLTDQDLKDIGVALGHRRRMLAAIREVAAATATEPKVFEPEPKRQDTAERRQVTVMFSDLVGSTALSARMDPEDLREVISAYQKCVAETVRRFDGFVAKYMGDGVLVYFGWRQLLFLFWRQQPVTLRATPRCSLSSTWSSKRQHRMCYAVMLERSHILHPHF